MAMLALGLVGMVLATVVAVGLFGGAIAARNLDQRLADDKARLVAMLERVDTTVGQLVTTTGHGADTLATTSDTLASAGTVLGQVADTATELSTSIDISILGSRPLAGAAARFGQLATDVSGFQVKAEALAQNLAVNTTDVRGLATEIEALRADIATLKDRIAGFETTGALVSLLIGGFVLLGLLVAWLAVAAAFLAWAGLRLRRLGATAQEAR